jgi:hypothetical protein
MHAAPPCRWLAALALALAGAAGAQTVKPDAASADRQAQAGCLAGSTTQDRATCLKEAAAARAERRQQRLDNGETPAQLRANALLRCQRVAADDRAACERMAQGEGQRSGSVAEGAVLKQITTPVPADAPSAATGPAAAPAPAATR